MTKLGYTWYPKDWGNSDSVFELTLIERGLYRELIDMAMLNDNKTLINIKSWARKFGSTEDEIEGILITLENLNLIVCTDINLFIPSCEPRLNLIRGGSKGGKKSKKNKPINKPLLSLDENNYKPIVNQKEIEIESKYKINISFDVFWDLYNKKKGDKEKIEKKWNKLKDDERQKIIDTLPAFLNSIKDKQFIPFPETYLNNKRWNDEIEINLELNKKHYYLSSPFGTWDGFLTEEEYINKTKSGHWTLIKIA